MTIDHVHEVLHPIVNYLTHMCVLKLVQDMLMIYASINNGMLVNVGKLTHQRYHLMYGFTNFYSSPKYAGGVF